MVWKSLQPSGEVPKLVTMACAPVAALHPVRRERTSLPVVWPTELCGR